MNKAKAKKTALEKMVSHSTPKGRDEEEREAIVSKIHHGRPWANDFGGGRHVSVQVFEWQDGSSCDPFFVNVHLLIPDDAIVAMSRDIYQVLKKYVNKHPLPRRMAEAIGAA